MPQPERKAVTNYPELNLIDVSGDWRTLEPRLMYRIRELPVLQDEAHRAIAYAAEYSDPPWHKDYFRERQYQFTRLGINAVILAVRLRKATGMPKHVLQVMMNGLQFPCFVKSGGAKEPCALLKLPATGSGIN